uniref:Heat shock transcription factor 1 n=1 Tax=Zea mays TaxID=4577 RepID=A0A804MNV1_MAIZE
MVEEGATAAASRSGPAPFLSKTHQMVEERGTDEVISWAEQGRSFVVWKPVELARDLLPLHFKHCNFSSFVRQLNTYGFRKVVPDRWEFANENFRRGEQGLLSGIRRRKSTTPQPSKYGGGSVVNTAFPPPLPLPPPASVATDRRPDQRERAAQEGQPHAVHRAGAGASALRGAPGLPLALPRRPAARPWAAHAGRRASGCR